MGLRVEYKLLSMTKTVIFRTSILHVIKDCEVCGEKLRGIGPFVEVSADGTKMSHFQEEKNVERKVEKEDSYWNRSIEEVVLDTVLSAITDYFQIILLSLHLLCTVELS